MPISTVYSRTGHFSTHSRLEMFRETPTQEVTETNRRSSFSFPKQSLNGVSFVSFSDKNVFT